METQKSIQKSTQVRIDAKCILYANVTVLDDTTIGPNTQLFPGVVIYHRCELGANVSIHANTVIGADGFGYRPSSDGASLIKIPQIGSVKIGDDVEIGASSCIDRGKFSATVIGDGTKIDNQCQIAHNCRIGQCCILAGQTGLAGSVTLGDRVVIGGKAGISDNLTIGNDAQIGGGSIVLDNVPADTTWLGYPAQNSRTALREISALHRLPDLVKSQKRSKK